MSQALISQYENSDRQIDADELPKFADFLGCHPCDFFDPPKSPIHIPTAFADAFEQEGAVRMLDDYVKLQDLTDHESAIVADLVESLKRNRVNPAQ